MLSGFIQIDPDCFPFSFDRPFQLSSKKGKESLGRIQDKYLDKYLAVKFRYIFILS